ncbi:SDR family oxidoreductase [Actinomadura rupiterrae]|uniref:SDR family oxidoreductase n=1 Tax=Actinomadura rupiterrae TaxID=559627 RepID=UPI0020A61695|nr:SDR family oxidoreductase [Actinomadura rupiterrae]MCP2340680.1 nucleoside-diphosphate-sugar epimerase [Actinomadura rupiterrae]
MGVHVVDGANGYVGANLISAMISAGDVVHALARVPGDVVAERVRSAPTAPTDLGMERLHPLCYALTSQSLGLSEEAVTGLFAVPCDYWHLAAVVNFNPGRRDELEAVNVAGTRRALEVFARHAKPGSRFFLISTAYVCGTEQRTFHEEWNERTDPEHFRNFYELTKNQSELVLRDYLRDGRVDGAAIRLGQVVGHSVTGHADTDYGVYDFMRTVSRFARRWPGRAIRVKGDPESALHWLPIDSCVDALLGIARSAVGDFDPPIFHALAANAVPVKDFLATISDRLPVDLSIVSPDEVDDHSMSRIERLVDARLSYTGKYINRTFAFDQSNLVRALGEPPAAVDRAMVDRLVSWCIATREDTDPDMEIPA